MPRATFNITLQKWYKNKIVSWGWIIVSNKIQVILVAITWDNDLSYSMNVQSELTHVQIAFWWIWRKCCLIQFSITICPKSSVLIFYEFTCTFAPNQIFNFDPLQSIYKIRVVFSEYKKKIIIRVGIFGACPRFEKSWKCVNNFECKLWNYIKHNYNYHQNILRNYF